MHADAEALLRDDAASTCSSSRRPTACTCRSRARRSRARSRSSSTSRSPPTPSAAATLVEDFAAAGVAFTVFQNRRWDGDFLTLRRIVEWRRARRRSRASSRASSASGPRSTAAAWRERGRRRGGRRPAAGPRRAPVDQALTLFGFPRRVYAEVDARRHGAQVDDDVFVALQHDGGARSHLWMSAVAPLGGRTLRVCATRGGARDAAADPQEDQLAAGLRPGDAGLGRERARPPRRRRPAAHALDGSSAAPTSGSTRVSATPCAATRRCPSIARDSVAALRVIEAARRSARTATVIDTTEVATVMKTSLGIWAMGSMVTRFNPAGYKPELAGRSHGRARPHGRHGPRRDDRRLRVPLSAGALRRQPRRGPRRRSTATASTRSPAACTSTTASRAAGCPRRDDEIRDEAVRQTIEAADFAGRLGARLIIWPGIEGYNYPFQTPYAESWARLIDGIGQAASKLAEHDQVLLLEHKNSEPAMKIHMGNIGMTLHVIHTLRARGIDNVKVNMDWQHLIMNGENLAEYAACWPPRGCSATSTRTPAGARSTTTTWSARPPSWRRSSSPSSCAARATARAASGSASTCTRTPRTPSTSCDAACCSGASSTARRRGSTTRRCARRSTRRTRSSAYELVYAALGA